MFDNVLCLVVVLFGSDSLSLLVSGLRNTRHQLLRPAIAFYRPLYEDKAPDWPKYCSAVDQRNTAMYSPVPLIGSGCPVDSLSSVHDLYVQPTVSNALLP